MFKSSAVSQIWKKYIQKLHDWDLPLISHNMSPSDIFLWIFLVHFLSWVVLKYPPLGQAASTEFYVFKPIPMQRRPHSTLVGQHIFTSLQLFPKFHEVLQEACTHILCQVFFFRSICFILFLVSDIRGVFDKFEDNIDNILIPKRKVWSTLSWKPVAYWERIVWKSLWFNWHDNNEYPFKYAKVAVPGALEKFKMTSYDVALCSLLI